MPRHPIGVVADRTGLSLDVLRVWERRHGVVTPERDEAGRRLYTDEDIERLRLLSRATEGGRTIGQVAGLDESALRALVREDEGSRWTAERPPAAAAETEPFVARSLDQASRLNGDGLEAVLRRAASVLGVPRFLEGVAAPLLVRIGEEWHAGRLRPSHEHLASAVVRSVVVDLWRSLPTEETAPGLAVATPAGERHEMGALLVAAAAAVEGWRVIYLGADLPAEEIARAAVERTARAVALSLVYVADAAAAAAEVAALRTVLPPDTLLLVGGAGAARLPELAGVIRLAALSALRTYLRDGAFPSPAV